MLVGTFTSVICSSNDSLLYCSSGDCSIREALFHKGGEERLDQRLRCMAYVSGVKSRQFFPGEKHALPSQIARFSRKKKHALRNRFCRNSWICVCVWGEGAVALRPLAPTPMINGMRPEMNSQPTVLLGVPVVCATLLHLPQFR